MMWLLVAYVRLNQIRNKHSSASTGRRTRRRHLASRRSAGRFRIREPIRPHGSDCLAVQRIRGSPRPPEPQEEQQHRDGTADAEQPGLGDCFGFEERLAALPSDAWCRAE